jgi:hypothetical protein
MKIWLGVALGAGLLLSGCGGDGGNSEEAAELSGVFQVGGITGLHYVTPTRSGLTDANGTFKYLAGESVAFSVGGIRLGSAAGAPAISPFTLVGLTPPRTESGLRGELDRASRANTGSFVRAINITRFLMALDMDHDLSNGIDLRGRLAPLANASLDFDQSISQFAVKLEKLTPDLTHNFPRWLPVVHLFRAVGITVPAHVPTNYDYLYYGSGVQGSTFSYYPDGSLKTQGTFSGFEGEDTFETLFTYDTLGRSISRKSGQFVSYWGDRIETQVTHYDPSGNLESRVQELDVGADETIDYRSVTDFDPGAYANILGQTTRYDLDNDGVVDQIETMIAHFDSRLNADNTVWEHDSNVDGVIDSRVVMTSSFDEANRVTGYTYESDPQADGTVDSSDHSTVEYSPDGRRVVERYESDFDGDGTAENVQVNDWALDARGAPLTLTVVSQYGGMTVQTVVKFDGDRRVLTEDTKNDWDGDGVFESLSHRSLHYDAIGNIQDAVIETDDDADGSWDYRYTTTYEYGADGEQKGYVQKTQWFQSVDPWVTTTMSAVNVPLADGVLALAQRYLDYFDSGGAVSLVSTPD